MRIQDVTGAETLLDHLQIICGNKSERYLFKVYISEMPNNKNRGDCPEVKPFVRHVDRPGRIKSFGDSWAAQCGVDGCLWHLDCATYQEASIALTGHLEKSHPGWDEPNTTAHLRADKENA